MDAPIIKEEGTEITEIRLVKRITIKHIFESVFEAFNIERGGVYTIKSLLRNPGKAIQDYLGANRFHYTPPFRVLLVTTAIAFYFISISHGVEQFDEGFVEGIPEPETTKLIEDAIRDFVSTYGNFVLWTFIPLAAIFSFWFNRKKGYNFAEHLVYQTYLFCIANLLVLLLPLDHYIDQQILTAIIYVIMLVYYVYAYKVFFDRSWLKSIWHIFWLMFLATIIWSLMLVVLISSFIAVDPALIPQQ